MLKCTRSLTCFPSRPIISFTHYSTIFATRTVRHHYRLCRFRIRESLGGDRRKTCLGSDLASLLTNLPPMVLASTIASAIVCEHRFSLGIGPVAGSFPTDVIQKRVRLEDRRQKLCPSGPSIPRKMVASTATGRISSQRPHTCPSQLPHAAVSVHVRHNVTVVFHALHVIQGSHKMHTRVPQPLWVTNVSC